MLTFVPQDTLSRMPLITTVFRGLRQLTGLKGQLDGARGAGSGDIKTGRHGTHRGSGG